MDALKLVAAELVDCLPFGVVFAAASGRALWWNRYADTILDARDGLSVDRSALRTRHPDEAARLAMLIGLACKPGSKPLPAAGAMSITRPSLKRSYALLISRFKRRAETKDPLAAILITDPAADPAISEVRLHGQFGLTPAEARLSALLVQGRSLEEAAGRLSIKPATARTHVRRLLQKTRTARQTELIRVLLSGPWLFQED